MKKAIMFMTAFLVGMFVTVPVYAEEAKFDSLSEVEVLLPRDSFIEGEPTVEGNGTDNVVITFDAATFKMTEVDGTIGRNSVAAWAGVRVYAPKGIGIDVLKNSKYDHADETPAASWWDKRDSKELDASNPEGQYFDFYAAIKTEFLTKASELKTKFVYTYRMDWDGNGEYDQTVKIIFNPAVITLKDTNAKDNAVVWTEENYLTTSKQIKLTYTATYSNDADSKVYTDIVYLDEGTKVTEDTFATLKTKVAENGLTIAGYYTDEEMTKEFDFNSELGQTNQIYIKLTLVEKTPEEDNTSTEEKTPEENNASTGDKAPEEENPSTGDNIVTYAIIGTVSLVCLLGTAIYFKKVNE